MRADRLVAALLLLQARGRVTAAELAEELEVSVATARRDLEALSGAGIPVYPQPGRGGGWSLIGGARTDLSGLTASEAQALFTLLGPSADAVPEARAALRKLMQALPDPFRPDAEAAARAVVVDQAGWGKHDRTRPPLVERLQDAVVRRRQVRLTYASRSRPRTGDEAGAGGEGRDAARGRREAGTAIGAAIGPAAGTGARREAGSGARDGGRGGAASDEVETRAGATSRASEAGPGRRGDTGKDDAGGGVGAASRASERVVDPWGLVDKDGVWYLVAGTDRGQRTFRVDRIVEAEVTDVPATRPDDFDLTDAWQQVVGEVEQRRSQVTATVLVAARVVQGLQAYFGRYAQVMGEEPDGRVRLLVGAQSTTAVAEQLAGWARMMEVVEPPEVLDELASIGAELVARYGGGRQ